MAPDRFVRREPSGPLFVPDPTVEVRYATRRAMGARLVGDAIEQKVRPQRRADEVNVVDDDRVGVEQRDTEAAALLGELIAGAVDVGAVELMVPGDVEDVAGLGPLLGRVAHRAGADWSKVSCAHSAFGEFRQRVVELEVEIGDNLNFHRADWLRPDSVIERTTVPVRAAGGCFPSLPVGGGRPGPPSFTRSRRRPPQASSP